MICDKCGKEMKDYIIDSEQYWECIECGTKAVTTYIKPINNDMTEYVIVIDKNNVVNKDTVSLLMKLTGLNLVQISNILKSQCPYEIIKAGAVKIKEISKRLDKVGITYYITPEFKW